MALILFGALVARLWFLQGIEHEVLRDEALTNVLEPVYEEAPRGRILDRNGRVLVDNKVVQVVTLDRKVLETLDEEETFEVLKNLAVAISRFGRPTKVSMIETEVADRRYGPFDRIPIAVDVNSELMVYLGERPRPVSRRPCRTAHDSQLPIRQSCGPSSWLRRSGHESRTRTSKRQP